MALQPEVISTPRSSRNAEERSNLQDMFPSMHRDDSMGDGLLLEKQRISNASYEMAALQQDKLNASPGLKKK